MKKSGLSSYYRILVGCMLISFILCSASRCKDVKHQTLFVIMEGQYSLGETGTVILNGETIGVVSEGNPIIKNIGEGNYSIQIHTQSIKGVMNGSFAKTDQNDVIFKVKCEPAQATITANEDFGILDQTYLVETVHFPNLQFTPGLAITANNIPPEQNAVFTFFDHTGKARHTVSKTLYYGEKWNYSIPYQ